MSWMEDARALLTTGTGVKCDAGHLGHDAIWVDANTGNGGAEWYMCVFDAARYADTPGYCPGDDDVSRTLSLNGIWEPAETAVARHVLSDTPGEVIDFGTHIGWYTMLALSFGREVLCVEALREHEMLVKVNAQAIGREGLIHQTWHWVDENTPYLPAEGAPPIALVKIDLEGNDIHAVRALTELLNAGNIANILCEISPVFNDSYPGLVRMLMEHYGFAAAVVNPWRPFTIDEIEDAVNEHPQVDMIFARKPWWPT